MNARQAEFSEKLNSFLLKARDAATQQFTYNEATNIPQHIIQPAESVALALRTGNASAWNHLHHWDTESAFEMAYAILEDANCHSEASALKTAHDQYNTAHT